MKKIDAPKAWGFIVARGELERLAHWDRGNFTGSPVRVRIIREADYQRLVKGKK